MVNASLNWASIVGIVLAVCGAGLYFLRSFKPALARDYDVFFAAIGLLCGGILFFQGWRLDPILQFGQFLLAGTTVFFAYESVRLRGIATDQARRSSYFDEEPEPARMPSGGLRGDWDDSYDQFEESQSFRRRFAGRGPQVDEEASEEDFYRPRRVSRAAIPEQAASRSIRRRPEEDSWKETDQARRRARFSNSDDQLNDRSATFGNRRNLQREQRRGTRPSANQQNPSRKRALENERPSSLNRGSSYSSSNRSPGVPQGAPVRLSAEDAAFSPSDSSRVSRPKGPTARSQGSRTSSFPPNSQSTKPSPNPKRRDNSSRFDN